jgi:hypothetical protein
VTQSGRFQTEAGKDLMARLYEESHHTCRQFIINDYYMADPEKMEERIKEQMADTHGNVAKGVMGFREITVEEQLRENIFYAGQQPGVRCFESKVYIMNPLQLKALLLDFEEKLLNEVYGKQVGHDYDGSETR